MTRRRRRRRQREMAEAHQRWRIEQLAARLDLLVEKVVELELIVKGVR